MKVTIALPVRNEQAVLRSSVEQVVSAARRLADQYQTVIVIADNGSIDDTEYLARELAERFSEVEYMRLADHGKGHGVLSAWEQFPADVYAFMDIDLATDLSALPELLVNVSSAADLVIGSRQHPESHVARSAGRRFVSFGYRQLVRAMFSTQVNDLPCGFKAVSHELWSELGSQVQDRRWFFDTELVLRAERGGWSVLEMPIVWRDNVSTDRPSQVRVFKLALEYWRCLHRLKKDLS